MNLNQQPFEKYCYSIDTESNNVIYQPSQEIHQHQVSRGYQVLSKNDFSKVKKRVNVGIFNKKTNFIIGEKSSLLFWDNHKRAVVNIDTSEALKEKSRYFLFYDLNFVTEDYNDKLKIYDKTTKENIEIVLNKQFGQDIGTFLRKFNSADTVIPDEFKILRSIIQIKDKHLTINKQILINSNPTFLLGILEGYIADLHYFDLKNNINVYNISYILNLLGAQYSIRSIPNGIKQIRFKLPIFLKQGSVLHENFFRKFKYIFLEDGADDTGPLLVLKKDIVDLKLEADNANFFEIVNSGLMEMIPLKDLVFLEIEDQIMYDLTMTKMEATNYSLPGTPLLKNSDGDILAVIALLTKDAAEEGIRKFSTEMKENFLNLATGEVNNWGVKLDAQLGLYSATT